MKKATIQYVSFPADRRVIAISDIHGNLPFLKGLLEKIQYSTDDILVLVGDVLEKGHHNLETLRYLVQLSHDHLIYKVAGNCDVLYEDVFEIFTRENDEEMLGYLLRRKGTDTGVLNQMSDEIGYEVSEDMDLKAWRRAMWEHFSEEFTFLRGWPEILASEQVVFVHAGITSDNLEDQMAWKCRKFDDFMGQGLKFSKCVVVGHWPTCNYPAGGYQDCNIRFDPEQNICAIDGGSIVKDEGQLNALIMSGGDPSKMSFASYDTFPVVKVDIPQENCEAEPYSFLWGRGMHWIEQLETQDDFILCCQELTGKQMWIHRDDLYFSSRDNRWCTAGSTTYRPELHVGDEVSVLRETSRGLLIKKDGIVGWWK